MWKGSCSLAEQRFELRHSEIQCWGSVTFWYGSVSSDPYLWLTNPDADPGGPKTYGFYRFYGKLVHLHHSSKIKSHEEVTKPMFFLLFLFDMEGSWAGSGAGAVLVTDAFGCGSGRPKSRIRIRMLIRFLNTAVILPTHAPTTPKATFEGSGGLKKNKQWPQIFMHETLKKT